MNGSSTLVFFLFDFMRLILRFLVLMAMIVIGVRAGVDAYAWNRDGKPVPAGLEESGSFPVEWIYVFGPHRYAAALREGKNLNIVLLDGPWHYPAGRAAGTTAWLTDDLAAGNLCG